LRKIIIPAILAVLIVAVLCGMFILASYLEPKTEYPANGVVQWKGYNEYTEATCLRMRAVLVAERREWYYGK